jgi:ribose transport system permease protein
MKTSLKKLMHNSTAGVYILLLITILVFLFFSPGSMNSVHMLDVVRQAAPLGIVAIGQTIVLLMAGIDLSVGSLITLVNVIAASMMMGSNQNIAITVIVALAVSMGVGFINGFIIAKIKIPPFLVTLAMSMVLEGVYYLYTQGSPKGNISPAFRVISSGWIGIIPISFIIWVVIWAVFAIFLRKTTLGRKIYTTGGNIQASWLSGIRTDCIVVLTYVMCSLLAGISGLIISAFIGVASLGVGNDYTLNCIAATVIGGTAFTGGIGGLSGTFAGVLIITFLQSLLTALNVPVSGEYISQGLVIAIMVAINQRRLFKFRSLD